MPIKHLKAGQHTCFGHLNGGGAAGETDGTVLERPAMLVYCGKFDSMDGPVEIEEKHLDALIESHNTRLAKFSKLAEGDEGSSVRGAPPLQLDHSASATVTVGRVTGKLSKGTYTSEDGKTVPALYTDGVRVLGKENVEKVKDGRWVHLSIGADLDTGKLNELSITPFPAAANAAILGARRMAKTVKIFDHKGKKVAVIQNGSEYYASCEGWESDPCKSVAEAEAAGKRIVAEEFGLSSKGAGMFTKLMAYLTRNKKLSEEKAKEELAKMSDEEKAKMAEDAEKAEKKEKLKKHLMDEEKCSADEAEEKLAKMDDEGKEKLGAEADEKAEKLAQESADADEKAKMAAKAAIVKLSKGLRVATSTIHLEAKKAAIGSRLAKLRAERKITPAEIKKQDMAKLAAMTDKECEAALSTFESRQPVIDMSMHGTAKAVNLAKIAQKYKLAKLEMETRMNMPSKREEAKKHLAKLAEEEQQEVKAAGGDGDGDADDTSGKMSYDEVAKMIDEVSDRERVKAAVKKLLDEKAEEMSVESGGAEKQMSTIAENVKQLQTQLSELVTMAGKSLGIESKDLE